MFDINYLNNNQKTVDLNNKTILLTGATGSIGSTIAKLAAQAGANLILLGANGKAINALLDEIEPFAGNYLGLKFDFLKATHDHFQQLATEIQQQFQHLDVIIHCAADFGGLKPLTEIDGKQWLESFHVNLSAPLLLNQACWSLLKLSKQSVILFSLADYQLINTAYWGSYGVTKSGLYGLLKITAAEAAIDDIQVLGVIPKPTQSILRKKAYVAENLTQLNTPEQSAQFYLQIMGNVQQWKTGSVIAEK